MLRGIAAIMFLLLVPPLTVEAQLISSPHNARSSAMGGCLVRELDTRHIDISYRQGFFLAGMADKRLSLVWPMGNMGVATAQYLHHGNLDYHEQQAEVGYALNVTTWMLVGVGAQYLNIGTSDPAYRHQQWLVASVYAQADLNKRTRVVLTTGSMPWYRQRPVRACLQVQYSPVNGVLTVVAGEMEERLRMRIGMEYSFDGPFFFRAGLATAPLIGTFGMGFRSGHFSIDIAAEVHQSLGVTPHTTLSLCF